jgi:type VI secretion system secreted protein Hcp
MAVDMFLKLDGIKGESKDKDHKDEIKIESMSWPLNQMGTQGSGGGGGAGKVDVGNISITKYVDKSTADLIYAVCSGKHIKDALITVRKAGGEKPLEYLKVTLTDVLVSSVQAAGSSADVLVESISLDFGKFKVEYFEQDSKGIGSPAGQVAWDVKGNAKA